MYSRNFEWEPPPYQYQLFLFSNNVHVIQVQCNVYLKKWCIHQHLHDMLAIISLKKNGSQMVYLQSISEVSTGSSQHSTLPHGSVVGGWVVVWVVGGWVVVSMVGCVVGTSSAEKYEMCWLKYCNHAVYKGLPVNSLHGQLYTQLQIAHCKLHYHAHSMCTPWPSASLI